MKVDGTTPTLQYSSSYWTNNQLLNSGTSSMNVSTGGDAKFRAFTTAPGVAVRLVMRTATGGSSFGSPVDLYTGSFTSLTALFSGPTLTTSTAKSTWLNILPGGIWNQPNCNYQGVNVGVSAGSYRLGIWLNGENDCSSCDSGVGVGGSGTWMSYNHVSSENFYYAGGGGLFFLSTYANVFVLQCAMGQVSIASAPFCIEGTISRQLIDCLHYT